MSLGYRITILYFMLALKKVKFTLEQAMNAQRRSRCLALLFLYRLRWKGVIFQRHTPAALLPGRNRTGTHFIGGWVGLRAGLDGGRKVSPPLGFYPRTAHAIASRCTDCAIPAHMLAMKTFVK
jgi:hypothetical protein